jgi:hypothetical protein
MKQTRHHCDKCRMTMRVSEPQTVTGTGQRHSNVTRCAEPGCGKRIWYAQPNQSPVIVGISEADLAKWKAKRETAL